MRVYRGTDGDTAPVALECERFGYPNLDSDGRMMYANTHFLTEREAWDSILASVKAGMSLAGARVADARAQLRIAEQHAADAAVEFAEAHSKYRVWRAGMREADREA